jgi:hypothetical protein
MKIGRKEYDKPTPKKLRRLGDSLLAVSSFVAAYSLTGSLPQWVGLAALGVGVIGKFLTNFFSES